MISDIQGYRFNFYKNKKNEFIFKNLIIFSIIYFLLSCIFYYYLVTIKKSYIESFFIVSFIYSFWDVCLFSMFDKGVNHWPVQLFDIFVVGGFAIILTQYIFYNYYDILKDYLLLLFIFYLLTMLLFFYRCYTYNPDLSNIKRYIFF
jgi:peptidoglycan/LPS O-acetylase OafA/YrhL